MIRASWRTSSSSRAYLLAKERAALEKIRERERMLPDFRRPLPGGTFPWLDGIKQA